MGDVEWVSFVVGVWRKPAQIRAFLVRVWRRTRGGRRRVERSERDIGVGGFATGKRRKEKGLAKLQKWPSLLSLFFGSQVVSY